MLLERKQMIPGDHLQSHDRLHTRATVLRMVILFLCSSLIYALFHWICEDRNGALFLLAISPVHMAALLLATKTQRSKLAINISLITLYISFLYFILSLDGIIGVHGMFLTLLPLIALLVLGLRAFFVWLGIVIATVLSLGLFAYPIMDLHTIPWLPLAAIPPEYVVLDQTLVYLGLMVLTPAIVYLINEEKEHYRKDLHRLNLRLQELSMVDELSGLKNRRAYNEISVHEFNRIKRTKGSIALIVIDIDHFKKCNDQYGHDYGDRVIAEIGKMLGKISRRANEHSFRIGGEEFILLLTDLSREECIARGEAVRKNVYEMRIPNELNQPYYCITVSIGAAYSHPGSDDNLSDLFHQADAALYTSKHHGRNLVRWHEETKG